MKTLIALAALLAISSGTVSAMADGTDAKSCKEEVGAATAADYVRDCLLNSPATHPPCNDANPCAQIVREVVRACDIGGVDGALCKKYRDLQTKLTHVASN